MKNKYILLTLLLFCYAAFANAAKSESVLSRWTTPRGYMASERTIPDVKMSFSFLPQTEIVPLFAAGN